MVENWEDQAYDLGSIYQKKSYDEIRAVLMANLSDLVKDCPEAADVPGFSLADHVVLEEETEEAVEETPVETKKTTAAKKTITTRFDDDDDEAELSAAPPKGGKDDDIFSMADDILNS